MPGWQGVLGRGSAQACYLEALRLDVCYAPAWRGLGDLLRESGELVQVITAPPPWKRTG